MNLFKRAGAVCLSLIMVSGTILPVFAANSIGSDVADYSNNPVVGQDTAQSKSSQYENVKANISSNVTRTTDVYAHQDSTYTVTLPKVIILNGDPSAAFSGAYTVSTAGNITGEQVLNIVPDETFALQQANKSDITTAVAQTKTAFTFDEMGTSTTGTVTAPSLSAGSWHGQFDFDISLETHVQPVENHHWDLSAANNESVIMDYDAETRTATISGSGQMKDYSSIPYSSPLNPIGLLMGAEEKRNTLLSGANEYKNMTHAERKAEIERIFAIVVNDSEPHNITGVPGLFDEEALGALTEHGAMTNAEREQALSNMVAGYKLIQADDNRSDLLEHLRSSDFDENGYCFYYGMIAFLDWSDWAYPTDRIIVEDDVVLDSAIFALSNPGFFHKVSSVEKAWTIPYQNVPLETIEFERAITSQELMYSLTLLGLPGLQSVVIDGVEYNYDYATLAAYHQ